MKRFPRLTAAIALLALLAAAVPALAADAQVVNINTATAEQLSNLPRIGPAIAQRIVEFREANGAFKKAEDLLLVKGIGEKTFELLKPHVRTSGETTLSEKLRAPRPAAEPASN